MAFTGKVEILEDGLVLEPVSLAIFKKRHGFTGCGLRVLRKRQRLATEDTCCADSDVQWVLTRCRNSLSAHVPLLTLHGGGRVCCSDTARPLSSEALLNGPDSVEVSFAVERLCRTLIFLI